MDEYDGYESYEEEPRPPDPREIQAVAALRVFFGENVERVYTYRQVEVHFERDFFHWVTNRALRDLIEEGLLKTETRDLAFGGEVKLVWHRSNRYYRRAAARVVEVVNEYSNPEVSGLLGHQGEMMVLAGFARAQFVLLGQHTREYGGRKWVLSEHNLDFIFGRDRLTYGVEVKNTLPYMALSEVEIKIQLCAHLGIKPLFVVRMFPATWVELVRRAGGFTLILKYQLYPLSHAKLAARVRQELGLPVDAPRALLDGTVQRFVRWHNKQVSG